MKFAPINTEVINKLLLLHKCHWPAQQFVNELFTIPSCKMLFAIADSYRFENGKSVNFLPENLPNKIKGKFF